MPQDDSGRVTAFDMLRLNPGPAWPDGMPWPAGQHTIPIRLPVPLASGVNDVALTGISVSSGAIYALVQRRNGKLTPAFDLDAWRSDMVLERYRPEHALPFSAGLPFHYHRLPGIVRNALASLMLVLSKWHAAACFPADLLDCGPLLVLS
jgi:hypothetical protein